MNLIFPLTLSCGHLASGTCDCWKGNYVFNPDGDGPIDRVLREFNGAWRKTLEGYGCQLPSGRNHGPCPVCGGKDRFRFDDKDGRGTWFCGQCDPQSGGGLLLLSRYLGKPTVEVAKELLGQDMPRTVAPVRKHSATDEQMREELRKRAKRGAEMLMEQSMLSGHPYMDAKGLAGEWPVNSQIMMGADNERIEPGALLLVPAYKNGELVNIQKITADGKKRPIYGGDMSGVCHVISGPGKTIAVVEGFATGVTVNRMTNATTYVAFNTGNLAAITAQARDEHPYSTLIIFADHDEVDPVHGWRPGTKFAEDAAVPAGAKIALPPELGDWDDYRQKYGAESCRIAMREAVRMDGKAPEAAPLADGIAPEESVSAPDVEENAPDGEENAPEEAPPLIIPGLFLPGNAEIPKIDVPKANDKELPDCVNFKRLDVDNPPGLAGRLVDYFRMGAHRELKGGAYSAVALQCMAMAGAGIPGYMGAKTSLITIILAESAAGKERAQDVTKELLAETGRELYGDIRSDKDLISSAVFNDGRCFYSVDEAQKLLNLGTSKNNQYTAAIPALLLEIATTGRLKLSRLHVEGFSESIFNSISRLEKEKVAKEESLAHCNPDHDKAKMAHLESELSKIEEKIAKAKASLDDIRGGIKRPCLNLIASSTPRELASIIDEKNIKSGLLGRSLVLDCGEEARERNFNIWGMNPADIGRLELAELEREICLIAQSADETAASDEQKEFSGRHGVTVKPTEAADKMMFEIAVHYEQNRFRNHQQLGSLYRRLSERVASLSSIMAFGNIQGNVAVIEPEYVEFALFLTLTSIEHLASNLKLNEAAAGESIEAQMDGISEAIIRKLPSDGSWKFQSDLKVLVSRNKAYKEIARQLSGSGQDAFNNAIINLTMKGVIEMEGKKIRKRML